MKNLSSQIIDPSLIDQVSRGLGLGGIGTSTYSTIHGINMHGGTPSLPQNKDSRGLVFFTKPCLNLSYNNVIGIRKMSYLANTDPLSMGNAIRCMLNPVNFDVAPSSGIKGGDNRVYGDSHRSSIVDDLNPFIPLLSNTLLTLSGWPDFVPETYTSKEGISKEAVSWIDGRPNIHSVFSLSATFANMEGDPVRQLLSTWIEYATRVAEGSMLPWPLNIVENRIDYQTRPYILTLDSTGTYVQHITAAGAAFPIADPAGAASNFNVEQVQTTANRQISTEFKAIGAIYDDPLLITSFNKTVVLSNPDMADAVRESKMIKLVSSDKEIISEKQLFNYMSYPRISDTSELEWWVLGDTYDDLLDSIQIDRGEE